VNRYSVTGLVEEVDGLLAGRYPHVLVEGELRQLTVVSSSGHAFMTLTDGRSMLQAVAWKSTWKSLRWRPREGQRVVVRGRLSIYGQRGAFQLYANDIRPAGEGDLARQIEARKARLGAEGLLDPRRKRPLPRFPRVVGVATSLHGAALQDFLRITGERFPAIRVLVAGCTVQGPTAPAEILRAVELLVEDGRAEVIVVTRGGGSQEDLMAFQDEDLARFLAHVPVPVVSAVGHESDNTIADLVADVAVPTPSAAAVKVVPDGPALARQILELEERLDRAVGRGLARRRREASELRRRLRDPQARLIDVRRRAVEQEQRLAQAARRRITLARDRVGSAEATLQRRAGHRVEVSRQRLLGLQGRLEALSPRAVLDRGYAVVMGPGGLVRAPGDVTAGDALRIDVAAGRVAAVVTD
jgi:exodeoxyribonuclease VII large subunit